MSMSKLFSEVSEFLKILFVNPVTNAVSEYSWTILQRFEIFFLRKTLFHERRNDQQEVRLLSHEKFTNND